MALSVFLKDTQRVTESGVESRFRNLLITSPAFYQLICAAAVFCYYLSNYSKLEASRYVPCPKTQQVKLPAFSLHYPFNAER